MKNRLIRRAIDSLELQDNSVTVVFAGLIVVYVAGLIVSNVVAVKSFAVFNWQVGGNPLSIAASVVVFPLTYIISDIVSEVYGYAWSRKISWLAFLVNMLMVLFITITIKIPGTDPAFDESYASILGSSFKIVMASQFAFLIGDFINDIIFRTMKNRDHGNRILRFVNRSLLSSLGGELTDSFVFLPLLYLAIGGYGTIIKSLPQFLTIVVIQAVLKTCVELIFSPLEVFIVNRVKKAEGQQLMTRR